MGFFDVVGSVAGKMDEKAKDLAKNASDEKLKDLLRKDPNNRYVKEEARRRGL